MTMKIRLAFFGYALVAYSYYIVSSSAPQEILRGTECPTATVLLVGAISENIAQWSTTLFLVRRLSFTIKYLIIIGIFAIGTALILIAHHLPHKLISVAIFNMGSGMSCVVFTELTTYYGDLAVVAFSSGLGAATLFWSFYNTVLSAWLNIPVVWIFSIILPINLMLMSSYIFMAKHQKIHTESQTNDTEEIESNSSRNLNSYGSLHDKEELINETEETKEENESPGSICTSLENTDMSKNDTDENTFSWKDKFSAFKKSFPLGLAGGISVFLKCFTLRSVVTTLAFRNSPFTPRGTFQYYFLASSLGEFIGRSYLLFVHMFSVSLANNIRIRRLWVFIIIEMTLFVFLVMSSLFRFLPSVYIVLVCLSLFGFLNAVIYVNASISLLEMNDSDLTCTFLEPMICSFQILGAILSMFIEPFLYQHCLNLYRNQPEMDQFCLTRAKTIIEYRTTGDLFKHDLNI